MVSMLPIISGIKFPLGYFFMNVSVLFCRLLIYSLNLLPFGVRHLPSYELFATVSKDEHGTGTAKVQAGSALLAKGGICYIGDILSLKKEAFKLLQTGTVSILTPCSLNSKFLKIYCILISSISCVKF